HLGGLEERVLGARADQSLDLRELDDLDALERPPVRGRDRLELVACFGERYIEAGLAVADAFEQELHRERGLADARRSVDQVQAIRGKPAGENMVEAGNASRSARQRSLVHRGPSLF